MRRAPAAIVVSFVHPRHAPNVEGHALESIMVVRIVPNESSNPPGKLADAELVFDEGVLADSS